ncbi:lipopolysaccharide biosynthesis protein [Pseudomonas sp. LF245]
MKPMPLANAKPASYAPASGAWRSTRSHLSLHDFDACRNTETGAVFIIASGMSGAAFPIEKFAHVPMITMNGAISMFMGTDVKPCFYACTDKSFSEQQPGLFEYAMAVSQNVALWEDHARASGIHPAGRLYTLSKAKKPSWFDTVRGKHVALVTNHPLPGAHQRPIGFSKDMSEGFFDARTVAYLTLQLAYHLGFSKVFLVGVDLHEKSGRFYENRESISSPCGLDQHYYTRILPSFELMARKVVGDSFRVYNLSDCSRIPESVVPRVTLADVEGLIG